VLSLSGDGRPHTRLRQLKSPRSKRLGWHWRLVWTPHDVQESLANAKVSTRQPLYIGRNSLNRPPLRFAQQYQRNIYIVEEYIQCATITSVIMRVYLHSFSRCCLPNIPTSAKFREKLNFKVIQGRWFWYESKAHIRVNLLVINSNLGLTLHRFWDTATCWLKIAYFS